MITSRGNPDGPTLDGEEIDEVHYKIPTKFEPRPACNNGAYNIRWTEDRTLVSCSACKTKISGAELPQNRKYK